MQVSSSSGHQTTMVSVKWLSQVINTQDPSKVVEIATLLSGIWKNRNAHIHHSPVKPANLVAQLAKRFVGECRRAKEVRPMTAPPPTDHTTLKWFPPPMEYVKVNVDASIRAQGVASLGIIARSRMGEVIVASGKNIAYSLDPQVGEALAVKHGLEIVGRAGLEKVIIESDCKQQVDMLNSGGCWRPLTGRYYCGRLC